MLDILKEIERHRLENRSHEDFDKLDRCKMLVEELFEYMSANTAEDELDALIDLSVFAIDTLFINGMSAENVQEAFYRVVEANSKKIVGKTDRCDHDLIKPEGWEPAYLRDLI